jgi:hypothetical protein
MTAYDKPEVLVLGDAAELVRGRKPLQGDAASLEVPRGIEDELD